MTRVFGMFEKGDATRLKENALYTDNGLIFKQEQTRCLLAFFLGNIFKNNYKELAKLAYMYIITLKE